MSTRADSVRVAHPLFQTEGGGSTPTSALTLRFERIDILTAKALNSLWHSRFPRFGTGFIKKQPFPCFGAEFGGLWYACAIWSNPAARMLPQKTWLELRRLAIAPDAPKNTASRMLGVMVRILRERLPHVERFISYQDTEVHAGTIYRAAGWTQGPTSAGDDWDRPSRSRPAAQSSAPKVRWEKIIRQPTEAP